MSARGGICSGLVPSSLLPVIGVLVCCGRPEPGIAEFRGDAMGTTYLVKYVGDQPVGEVRSAVEAALRDFDLVFSTYRPDSEISRFNAHPAGAVFAASDQLLSVVREALRIAASTGGAFDPTVMPVVRTWGFGPVGGRSAGAAEPEDLEEARRRVGWEKLELRAGGLVKLAAGVELDLNAIAKGAGVDRVAWVLAARGIRSFMVEIGGEVYCAGEKGPGRPWSIGVVDPADGRSVQGRDVVPLRDLAMATSGTYFNWVELDGRRVHHVIDPRTGRNAANRVVSVSVIAPNCTLADGLATACMVLGPDAAERVLRAEPGIRALFLVAADGGGLERREYGW